MAAWDGPAEEMDSALHQIALEVFGTMAERKKAAIRGCRLTQAGRLLLWLLHRCDGLPGRRGPWGALVVECDGLLPEGLPLEVLRESAAIATAAPPAGWQERMRVLTRYIRRRLARLRRKEATGRQFRKILE
ncbi:hypothetical protein H4R19_007130 [Coemansia spiralis]|nr:hypothetical protein H4R19_007130 [Coemansia spiralis]